MKHRLAAAVFLASCSSTGAIDGTDTGTPATAPTAEVSEPTDTVPRGEEPLLPLPGFWRLEFSRTTVDDCGFDAHLEGLVFDVMANLYMPETFTVALEDEQFFIMANDYGARGPIACDVEGDTFSCETQLVDAALGWSYAIDFTGNVHEDDELRGTSVVSYTGVDSYYEGVFADIGFDYTACTTTHLMELRWADW